MNDSAQELISVIVPVYNAESYLELCLNSLTNQEYTAIEILVIDDGSTDNSLNIASELAIKDSRIRCIHTENGGVAKARNIGLENCKGDYITFVDADDYVSPSFISILYQTLIYGKTSVSQILFFAIQRDQFHKIEPILFEKEKVNIISKDDFFQKYAFDQQGGKLYNKLYRKTLLTGFRFNSLQHYGEDSCFSCGAVVLCDNISTYDAYLYCYLLTPNSATLRRYSLARLQELNSFEVICSLDVVKKNKKVLMAFYLAYARCLACHFRLVKRYFPAEKLCVNSLKSRISTICCSMNRESNWFSLARIRSFFYKHFPSFSALFYLKTTKLQKRL